jgi:penicillin amidase
VDGDMLAMIGDGGYDLGARARQIRDGLYAKDRFEPVDMLAIQRDSRALFLTPWRNRLLEALSDERIAGRPQLETARDILDGWLAEAAPSSRGYRLVRAFRLEFRRTMFDALTHTAAARAGDSPSLLMSNQFEAPLWQLVSEEPPHLLPAGFDDWDGLIVDTLERAILRLTDGDPARLPDSTWGSVNTASIRHPLSTALPQLSGWLDMPAEPLHGDANLPLAQGPSFGASERFSVSPGNERQGLMHMPAGQSGHPLSPYYRAGHDDWADGRPSPFLPGDAVHTLELVPLDAADALP